MNCVWIRICAIKMTLIKHKLLILQVVSHIHGMVQTSVLLYYQSTDVWSKVNWLPALLTTNSKHRGGLVPMQVAT